MQLVVLFAATARLVVEQWQCVVWVQHARHSPGRGAYCSELCVTAQVRVLWLVSVQPLGSSTFVLALAPVLVARTLHERRSCALWVASGGRRGCGSSRYYQVSQAK